MFPPLHLRDVFRLRDGPTETWTGFRRTEEGKKTKSFHISHHSITVLEFQTIQPRPIVSSAVTELVAVCDHGHILKIFTHRGL